MDENVLTSTPTEVAEVSDLPPLDLNELQAMSPAELEEICRRFDVRMHPGRTRHHHILDLVRGALDSSGARDGRRIFRSGGRFIRIASFPGAEFPAGAGRRGRPARDGAAFSVSSRTIGRRHSAAAARPRENDHARRSHRDRRAAGGGMAGANPVRQIDAALSGRPDHPGEPQERIDQRARGRFAHATGQRSTRVDRGRAARRQNDFAEGNRQSDPPQSSGDRAHHPARR